MDYLYALQQIRETSPSFINLFCVGYSEVMIKLALVVPVIFYWSINKQMGQWMMLNYTGGYFVNQTVKNIFCVYRPWVLDSRLHVAKEAAAGATGYSLPSGHTATMTLIFESIAVGQERFLEKKNRLVSIFCIVLIILMAFCRNWLGAHTLKDVVTAVIISSVVIILNIFLFRIAQKYSSRDWIFLIAGIVICVGITLFLQFKNYPADVDSEGNYLADPYKMLTDCYTAAGMFGGFIIGWFLERRFVNFAEAQTVKQRVFRSVFGVASGVLLYFVILPLILKKTDAHAAHFIKYFVFFLYLTFIYPVFMKLVERNHKPENTAENLNE